MRQEKMIHAYVREEFMVTEGELEIVKRFRNADKSTQEAIKLVLEMNESDESDELEM